MHIWQTLEIEYSYLEKSSFHRCWSQTLELAHLKMDYRRSWGPKFGSLSQDGLQNVSPSCLRIITFKNDCKDKIQY